MKIAEVCLSDNLGGLELYFFDCCRWFWESEMELVAVVRKDSRLETLCKNNQIAYVAIGWRGSLLKAIPHIEADIVHVHHKSDLLALALARKIHKSFLLVHTRQMAVPKSKRDPYHVLVYGQIDLLLTITELLKQQCLERIPIEDDRVRRLYYGVPEPQGEADCNDHSSEFFNVGLFSRIEHQKGQHLVVDAAKILKDKGHTIRFDIWGDIMDKQYGNALGKQIKLHELDDVVRLRGFNPNPSNDMPCYDVIALPSENETFGLVLAEAMRASVAVIGTNAGGVPEIIEDGETGLLFSWGNAEQLANQIEKLYLDGNLRAEIASKGKLKADKVFNRENHFQELQNHFKTLTNNRGS